MITRNDTFAATRKALFTGFLGQALLVTRHQRVRTQHQLSAQQAVAARVSASAISISSLPCGKLIYHVIRISNLLFPAFCGNRDKAGDR